MNAFVARGKRSIADLPLRRKILIPFAALAILYAASGTYVFTKGAASERRASSEGRLLRAATAAARRLEVAEGDAASLARQVALTEGLGPAIAGADASGLRRLVIGPSVNAASALTAVVSASGASLLEVLMVDGAPKVRPGVPWGRGIGHDAIANGRNGGLRSGTFTRAGIRYLGVASPVFRADAVVGAVIAGVPLASLETSQGELLGATVRIVTAGGPVAGLTGDGGLGVPFRGRAQGLPVDAVVVPVKIGTAQQARIVITLPAVAGLALLGSNAWRIGTVAVGALMGVILVGAWISRLLAQPINGLASSTRALAAGDLTHRASIEGSDEVGQLGAAFNQMAVQLEDSHNSLERRVQERTQALNEAMQELARTNGDLQRANRAKDGLLANVSHELRTPLSGVLIAAEMLHDPMFGPIEEARTRDFAGKIVASGRYLLTLIDDLLDLSRIESGHLEMRARGIELAPLLAEVRDATEGVAREKGIKLKIASGRGHQIDADPVRMKQVLLNLLSNAMNHTARRGRVTLDVARSGRSIALCVRDTGTGIARKDLQRIFEPFQQGSNATGTHGAGLGLAIAKRIVELHRGKLTVRSVVGQGSAFTVALPACAEAAEDVPVTTPQEAGRAVGVPRGALVLIVEDDPTTADLAERVLRTSGYGVRVAATVDTALASISAERPRLVLLDVRLGSEDGLDVVRALRRDGDGLPVLAMSAHGMAADVRRALASGCRDYLTKPVGARALLVAVSKALAPPADGDGAPADGDGVIADGTEREKILVEAVR